MMMRLTRVHGLASSGNSGHATVVQVSPPMEWNTSSRERRKAGSKLISHARPECRRLKMKCDRKRKTIWYSNPGIDHPRAEIVLCRSAMFKLYPKKPG